MIHTRLILKFPLTCLLFFCMGCLQFFLADYNSPLLLYSLFPFFTFMSLYRFWSTWLLNIYAFYVGAIFYIYFGLLSSFHKLFALPMSLSFFLTFLFSLAMAAPYLLANYFILRVSRYLNWNKDTLYLWIPFGIYMGDLCSSALSPIPHAALLSTSSHPYVNLISIFGVEGTSFLIHQLFSYFFFLLVQIEKFRRFPLRTASTLTIWSIILALISFIEGRKWDRPFQQIPVTYYQSQHKYTFNKGEKFYISQEKNFLLEFEQFLMDPISKAEQAKILILPETFVVSNLYQYNNNSELFYKIIKNFNGTTFVGAEIHEDRHYNGLLLINKMNEPFFNYKKSLLVPFAEYKPGSTLIPQWRSYLLGKDDFSSGPGTQTGIIDVDELRVGVAICYESIFSSTFLQHLSNDAQIIVSVANDSLFGNWGMSYFHTLITAARALEVRLPLIHLSAQGGSLVTSSTGKRIAFSGYQKGLFFVNAPINKTQERTLFSVLSYWVFVVLFLMQLFCHHFRKRLVTT